MVHGGVGLLNSPVYGYMLATGGKGNGDQAIDIGHRHRG